MGSELEKRDEGLPQVFGPSDELIVDFQRKVDKLVDPALRTLHELCEMADSEGVRLNAATQILYFAGLRQPKRRWQPLQEEGEHEAGVARELGLLLERLDRNRPGLIDAVADAARDEQQRMQVVDAEVVEDHSDGDA